MVEGNQQSIIAEIVNKRKIEAAHKLSVGEAYKELSSFTTRIDNLILKNVPEPEIEMEDWETHVKGSYPSFGFGRREHSNLSTTLQAVIDTAQGDIVINISTDRYPNEENKQAAEYRVDVKDLDYYMVIKNGVWKLESKSRDNDAHFDMNTPIGGEIHTWPSWEKDVNMENLSLHKELFHYLENNEGVKFTGSTPNKKVLDESTRPPTKTFIFRQPKS